MLHISNYCLSNMIYIVEVPWVNFFLADYSIVQPVIFSSTQLCCSAVSQMKILYNSSPFTCKQTNKQKTIFLLFFFFLKVLWKIILSTIFFPLNPTWEISEQTDWFHFGFKQILGYRSSQGTANETIRCSKFLGTALWYTSASVIWVNVIPFVAWI